MHKFAKTCFRPLLMATRNINVERYVHGKLKISHQSETVQQFYVHIDGPIIVYSGHVNSNVESYTPYKNGLKHGTHIRYDSCGEKIVEKIEYENGKKNGKTFIINWSEREDMHFFNDVLHGTYTKRFPNNEISIKCEFYYGKLHGEYTEYYASCESLGEFKNIKHTKKRHIEMNNGLKNGIETMWYPNGNKERETLFEYGKILRIKEYDINEKEKRLSQKE